MSASKKTRRQLADEAFLRVSQIDMGGAITASAVKEPEQRADVPANCPECQAAMRLGCGWTALSGDPAGRLQCGQCGHTIAVSLPVFEQFKADVRSFFEARARALDPLPKRTKRTRGAE